MKKIYIFIIILCILVIVPVFVFWCYNTDCHCKYRAHCICQCLQRGRDLINCGGHEVCTSSTRLAEQHLNESDWWNNSSDDVFDTGRLFHIQSSFVCYKHSIYISIHRILQSPDWSVNWFRSNVIRLCGIHSFLNWSWWRITDSKFCTASWIQLVDTVFFLIQQS